MRQNSQSELISTIVIKPQTALTKCPISTHLLSLLVRGCGVRLHVVELRLHAVQPLVEVVVGAGESRGQLQRLLQGAEGFAAAGRHLGVARLDAVQLLLDQEDLLACREETQLCVYYES